MQVKNGENGGIPDKFAWVEKDIVQTWVYSEINIKALAFTLPYY